jgi:N-carbamoyl-L-amino-acid hydrolase
MTRDLPNLNVSPELLGQLMDELSTFGATAGGGLHRLTASADDGKARNWLSNKFKEYGFRSYTDSVGNMFGVLECSGPDAPILFSGSHLDSQPFGGRYDGAFGVVAALISVRTLSQWFETENIRPQYNLGVVNWTNEEGARFAPSLLGSKVFAGSLDEHEALSIQDSDGIELRTALKDIGFAGADKPPKNIAGYIEVHIEQGPALEQAGKKIGVVEGNWGTAKYQITFEGKATHTGPTPMSARIDALLPVASLILFMRKLSDETDGELLTSVGRLDIEPNSTNVVAGRVKLYAELRDIDSERLKKARDRLEEQVKALTTDGIQSTLKCVVDRPVGQFDPKLTDVIEKAAESCGYSSMRLHSVAGHDAVAISGVVPSAMIFVPSTDGLSHNENEFTADEDLLAGANVLAQALGLLATDSLS